MPVVSSIFLVISLTLAVVIGPQTRPWTWGPALLALAVATLAAIPVIAWRGKFQGDFGSLVLAALTALWFAIRAWMSPVAELGQADLLLVAAAIGAFVSVRAIAGNMAAERILAWGIALLLLANLVVIGKQVFDPAYTPVFRARPTEKMISGFFAHYNETANYLIASSMMVGAAALFGKHAPTGRFLLGLTALSALAGVWFTLSRGGILGAAVAGGVFFALTMIFGKRRNSKWFAPALITVPVIGIGLGAFLLHGWLNAQDARHAGTGLDELMDNDCRLYFLGIALSCVALHPMAGGGARSFSWECFRFWDKDVQGAGGAKPGFVHNELAQAAADYGLIGAGLLTGFVATWVITVVLRSLFEEIPNERDHRETWRIGATAALAGMLVQSCFSFVFHLLPGILLLGICLAQMSRTPDKAANSRTVGTKLILGIAAAASLFLIIPAGWNGARVTKILWPSYFSKVAVTTSEARIEALSDAIEIWPMSTFHQERAALYQTIAAENHSGGHLQDAERAVSDYQQALLLHPHDPGIVVNLANLLSQLQRDHEAEDAFSRALELQGGMEAGFRVHFHLARHLQQKGLRLYHVNKPDEAMETLQAAVTHIEKAIELTPAWVINVEGRNLRISIHENLGTLLEAMSDPQGALQSYDFATSIPGGQRAHYLAGVLIGKQAVDAWMKRRPSEALSLFIEARKRIGQAGNQLPEGVTPSMKAGYMAYLDEKIAFLKGAKVTPE